MKTSPELCVACKGVKKLCGSNFCPLLVKSELYKKHEVKKEIGVHLPAYLLAVLDIQKFMLGQ